MRHEREEEPRQISLPEVQEKIRRYNAYGRLIVPEKPSKG
jgi:hypothetical protein